MFSRLILANKILLYIYTNDTYCSFFYKCRQIVDVAKTFKIILFSLLNLRLSRDYIYLLAIQMEPSTSGHSGHQNIPMLQLNNGQLMPQLGLGTYDVLNTY